MASNIDKEIQELISIKLGLEQKSEDIFNQLLKAKINDPLDDIFKSMLNKNHEIQILKKQVFMLKQQNKKLKGQSGSFGSTSGTADQSRTQFRSLSLPPNHEKDLQNIEQKKKSVDALKEQYKKNVQKYIIFLIKCIREVSKSQITKYEDTEKLIKNLEKSLRKQQDRILELTDSKERPFDKFNTLSQISTQASKIADGNLEKLIKSLNQTTDPETMFTKINESLGLKQKWEIYISKLKQESQMFYFLKDVLYQTQKENDKITQQQIRQSGSSRFAWQIMLERTRNNFEDKTSVNSIKTHMNEIFESTKIQLGKVPDKAFNLVKSTIVYFYEKLDEMFKKHNQHPYKMSLRPQFSKFDERVHKLILHQSWEQALETIKTEINDAFYLIERRTKFHTANRVLLRNNT